jgi:hypothetical protein
MAALGSLNTMVSRCANPACSVPLRYLRDGRLFQFEVRSRTLAALEKPARRQGNASRQIAHFWLCGNCAETLTLTFDEFKGVTVVPLQTIMD